MTDDRRALLRAALGFLVIRWSGAPPAPAAALATWLDSWTGIGQIAVGMHRHGYDIALTQYDDRGWRATWFVTGMEHSQPMPELRVLPLGLRLGDRLGEADGEWVVVRGPTSYRAGKMVRAQVKRADGSA